VDGELLRRIKRVTRAGDTAIPADRLAAGDRQAFADLYDRLAPRLFAAAVSLTGSTPEAEDIVQDVFVELARARHRIPGIADLEAYVFTMLHHTVGRRHRRRAVDLRAVHRIGAELAANGGLVQEPVPPTDDELAAAVARLPAAQREVVSLKIDGGLTFAQIAVLLLAPWLATVATSATGRETRRVPSLAERVLAAGVAAEMLPAARSPSSYARLASQPSRVDDGGPAARLSEPFRVRRLLEGDF